MCCVCLIVGLLVLGPIWQDQIMAKYSNQGRYETYLETESSKRFIHVPFLNLCFLRRRPGVTTHPKATTF